MNAYEALKIIRREKQVWVSIPDFAALLGHGVRPIPAKEALLKGLAGTLGDTKVSIDRALKQGQLKLGSDDSIVSVTL